MKLKNRICAAVLTLPLIAVSCGARVDHPGPVSDAGESRALGESRESAGEEKPSGGSGAAAEFHYMEVDSELSGWLYQSYAVNQEWLYVTDRLETDFSITRKRISDGFQEDSFAVTSIEWSYRNEPLLLADREGNCYIYWKLHQDYQDSADPDEESSYRLEKYGADGKLLWEAAFGPDEMEGMGESLNQGTVTGDGRVILYNEGDGGCVFAFGQGGGLEEIYTPELKSLEGVAVGKDNCVYGYCITGREPLFAELGGETHACPVTPLAVYSGYGEGICLRTGEGMFSYVPESGETEKLWDWTDEYVQIDGDNVDRVFQDGGAYMLLCLEMPTSGLYNKQVLTFSAVTPGGGREYPERQTVTLATEFLNSDLSLLVQMYNRESRKYRIEIKTEAFDVYEKRLVRGDGMDLMEVSRIYTGDLARHGAFEELDSRYEDNPAVSKEDILGSILEAGTIGGKNVAVIVNFDITTLRARGDFVRPEEWTVWKFLEMGEEEQMFSSQSPQRALNLCMGLTYGEHFVDYEKRTCSFDGEEFRRILEACGRWKKYEDDSKTEYSRKKGDWLFDELYIHDSRDIIPPEPRDGYVSEYYEYGGNDYLSTLVGYPGWEGGEYKLRPRITLAINSASGNKEGAWDFLEYLLSEEIQSVMAQVSGCLPVRRDCFEMCIRNDYADSAYGEPVLPTEEEIQRVREMAEAAVKDDWGSWSNPLWTIVNEEAGMYFAGDADLDATVQKIQTRVQLFLNEL